MGPRYEFDSTNRTLEATSVSGMFAHLCHFHFVILWILAELYNVQLGIRKPISME